MKKADEAPAPIPTQVELTEAYDTQNQGKFKNHII
jgi:hypothetical protein